MDRVRFIEAQTPVWDAVLAELGAGRKATHWMWFVFPQLAALGRSATAQRFGLADAAEARAYETDPVLGPRLRAALAAAMGSGEADPVALFGPVDAMKFRSSLTLFAEAAADPAPYLAALDRFYGGRKDAATLVLLRRG
jgi:uncharacterized protein (DUF1810 family)